MNDAVCSVCISPFNKTSRSAVNCARCHYTSCRSCYKQYILQQTEPKCMNCFKVMTRGELVSNFTKTWVNTKYKIYREQCLLNLEKAMLPATQPIVEQQIESENIRTLLSELRNQMVQLRQTIRMYEDQLRDGPSESALRKSFIRKCPNSSCRGFLSSQWKCNLCSLKTCKECNECITEEDHKCDPNNVETARFIAKDTKPCPKCGEMIFKIDGCDQMYCTICHSAFSWRTGKIETGVVHNPHYFDWLRMNNRTENEIRIQCGREIDNNFIRGARREGFCNDAIGLCRNLLHFRYVNLPRFRTNDFQDNQDLRIQYLRNQITEEVFSSTVQKRDKARQKRTELYRLFAMMIQCVTEIIYRYYEECCANTVNNTFTVYDNYQNEINNLLEYVNSYLGTISNLYNSKRYVVSNKLELRTIN